jgi:ADP-heptose:LPS heptosyltransferase
MQGVPRVLSKVPVRATGAIDRMARGLASGPVGRALVRRQFRRLAGVLRPERVLVIADVNIGDAMLIQPAVAALDGLLPDATIDFAVNATVGPLVADDPRVGTTFAVLRGDADAPAVTAQRLREALDHADYGLVVNACPFIGDRDAASFGGAVVSPLSLAVGILDAYAGGRPAAVPIQVSALVHRALDAMPGVDVPEHPTTESSRVYLRAQVRRDAVALLRELDIDPTRPTVFVNPDTSNDSTFLGEDVLVEVVARMTALPSAGGVLLGRGFTYRGVEDRILEALDGEQRRAVRLVPEEFPLDAFCGVVDCCDVVISGDTGPMHLAVAEKVARRDAHGFVNRTAVVNVFKATDPRIYGYGPPPEFAAGGQRVAPVPIEARPDCKNLVCSVQRLIASCPADRCQETLDAADIARAATDALSSADGRRDAS